MSTLAERLTDIIDQERDRQIDFLAAIVRMPSDNPAGDCAPHAEATARLIEALGFTVERHAVPEELVRANGMVSATNLIVRHRFGDGPVVALNAHGDVVPPGEGWTHDPYGAEIVDGWMYGRGVAVSKSDFATYLWALIALKESGAALGGTVELHFTYDEEAGGEIGPGWLLREGLSRPDYALSAGFSYGVVNAHNGCLHLEVEVNGRSAHAAKPSDGVDAIAVACSMVTELQKIVSREIDPYDPLVVSVTGIEGGGAYNVIAPEVRLKGTIRSGHEETRQKAWRRLRQILEGVAATHDAGVAVNIQRGEPPVVNAPEMVAIVRQAGAEVVGRDNVLNAPGWTAADDFAFYSEKCPSVYFRLGIRNEAIEAVYPLHHPRFRVDETALPKGAMTLVSAALRFLRQPD
ncbi:MAG: amidohydrolase [Achromobacter sp.]|nr:amidohydrolase [Achromobacter sp.]